MCLCNLPLLILFEQNPFSPSPGGSLAPTVSAHHSDIPAVYFFTLAVSNTVDSSFKSFGDSLV